MTAHRPTEPEVVVRRYFRAGLLTMAHATRPVRSPGLPGGLLWGAVGSDYAARRRPDGTAVREEEPAVLARAPLGVTAWVDLDVLVWHRPDRAHAVWWCYRDGEFVAWYVNLETPARSWRQGRCAGMDTVDHALDIVVTPDRNARWKDVDEFEWATGRSGFWDAAQAARIRAEGERVVREVALHRFPFDGTWCAAPPELPPGPPAALAGTPWSTHPPALLPSVAA